MDGRAFDEITRTLATGASRRRVLGGLAGAALAALGVGRVRAAQTDATGQMCGGIAAIACPPGFTCVDDPSDDCDPTAGGADCSGVCQPVSTPGCAAILCEVGTDCCENCGGICVPAGTPCSDALCGGETCGSVVCGAAEFCCNESCSICAPLGGACTQQFCGDDPDEPGEPCNRVTCGAGEFCCNESCSICAPAGGSCTEQFCDDTCAQPGEACASNPNGCCQDLICGDDGICAAGVVGPPVCRTDADCAAGITDPCTGATCDNGTCVVTSVLCAPGFVCCGNGQCCEDTCAGPGEACTSSANGCCQDLVCGSDGICAIGVVGPNVCQTDADCVTGSTDPCTGATCDNGTCVVTSVLCAPGFVCCGNGQCCPIECETDADCPEDPCNFVGCNDGRCISTLRACVCAAEGEACGDGVAACCDGFACRRSDGGGRICVARPVRTTPTPEPPAPPTTPVAPQPPAPPKTPTAPKPTAPVAPAPAPQVPSVRPPTGGSSGAQPVPQSSGTGATTVRSLPNTGRVGAEATPVGRWAAVLAGAAAAAAAVVDRFRPDAAGEDGTPG